MDKKEISEGAQKAEEISELIAGLLSKHAVETGEKYDLEVLCSGLFVLQLDLISTHMNISRKDALAKIRGQLQEIEAMGEGNA